MKWFTLVLLFTFTYVALVVSDMEIDEDDDDVVIEDEDDVQELNIPKKEKPVYQPPKPKGNAHFADGFVSEDTFKKRWVPSEAKKDDTDEDIAKYDGKWNIEEPTDNPLAKDLMMILKSKAKHHAISSRLDKPFDFSGKPLFVQYEVKFQNGQECGGAYIKLLSDDKKQNLKQFTDRTPYTIMFGPDKCGNDEKLHFIFRHKNPITGEFEEKHAKKPASVAISNVFSDKKTHLFRLVVNPDNSYEVFVDQDMTHSGSLLEDVNPPVNPPKEIDDPEDKKPEDWDEREKIPDPDAEKPEDWDEDAPEYMEDESATMPDGWLEDEEELSPDPDAQMPDDWDSDMDGEWEPPMINNPACESAPGCGKWHMPQIKNPEYKGKWKAPKIDNPNYKGKWKPQRIANPNFFEDLNPYKMTPIGAVGLELWSMSNDIGFDNFLVTDDKAVIEQWTKDTFHLKQLQELEDSSGQSVVDAVLDMTNERPWLWAVILVVVVLPIVLVIAYCCSGGSSTAKWVPWLKKIADEKPWMYAVVVAVVLFPAVIISMWLCPKGLPFKKIEIDDTAERKKTDAPTPDDASTAKPAEESTDDEEQQGDEADGEEGQGDAAAKSKGSPSKAKSKSPKKSPSKPSKSDLDADNAEQEDADAEEEEADEPPKTRSSPRKRTTKARKD